MFLVQYCIIIIPLTLSVPIVVVMLITNGLLNIESNKETSNNKCQKLLSFVGHLTDLLTTKSPLNTLT